MFHLKLNVYEIIHLKAQYFKYSSLTGIDDDIHELLQDKLWKHDNSNKKQYNYIFKIDYEKLVNIYYFLKARAVWCELPEELVSVMNKCVVKDKRIVN